MILRGGKGEIADSARRTGDDICRETEGNRGMRVIW